MKTYIEIVHKESKINGSDSYAKPTILGLIRNFNFEDNFEDTFTFYISPKGSVVIFDTFLELGDHLLFGNECGKAAYLTTSKFYEWVENGLEGKLVDSLEFIYNERKKESNF